MAGDFIRWQKGLHRKPEVGQISRMSGLDAFSVAARCMAVWEWADEVTTTGVIDGATREQVDMIAMHPGFAAALESTRPHPWLLIDDQGLTFPNYDRHNGRCAKFRERDAERKREWRASIRHPTSRPPSHPTSRPPMRPRDVP
jgi:hypothetical protein